MIGNISIARMIAKLAPGEMILFPAKKYKSHDAVRGRATEAMIENARRRYRTFREREGSFVYRVR